MTKNTPVFPNPTILEAICEIHFTSSEDLQSEWDGKWYGRLHSILGADFEMEPKTAKGVIVQTIGQGKTDVSESLIPINQMLYKHKSKEQLIQLAPWFLAINEVGRYPGWKYFLGHIEHGWKSLTKIIEPIGVTRIGMRYINRIPKETLEETVGDWLNNNDIFPKQFLSQFKDFFLRCEMPLGNDVKIIVTITEEQTCSPIKPIIFDIDTVMVKKHDDNWIEINKSISLLHEHIRNVFDSSQAEKLKNYLNNQK